MQPPLIKKIKVMLSAQDVIVISDLHLAPERGMGLFQADAELSNFLDWVLDEARNSIVVLDGDIVDFLVIKPSESFSNVFDPQSVSARTTSIVDHHTEVFEALSRLARSPLHQLIIISGNHDPEIIFPAVQQSIETRLGGSGGRPLARWVVHGEAVAIHVGEANAIIEHGDMFDDWNRIDYDALRKGLSLANRGLWAHTKYNPPPGSHLVVDYGTELREEFPWVDLLKPEREAVIPILFSFLPPKRQYKLVGALRQWLWSFGRSVVTDLRVASNKAKTVRAAGDGDLRRKNFIEWLNAIEEEPKRGFSKEDRIARLIPKLRKASTEDHFFDIGTPDATHEDVAFLLRQGADLIVHGHTHSAKAYKVGKGLYLNTGTWGRLMRLPQSHASDSDWRTFLESLSGGDYGGFLRATFARIKCSLDGASTTAALMEWRGNAPASVSEWRFQPEPRVATGTLEYGHYLRVLSGYRSIR